MAIARPFNLHQWIEDNQDLLKPPVSNKNLYAEAGDFIVYLQSGYSLKRSLFYNLATGIGNLAGCLSALQWGMLTSVEESIIPIVVGNFLYIALTTMLGQLTQQSNKKYLFFEVILFGVGVLMITLLEASEH